jgi:hypothetical protein
LPALTCQQDGAHPVGRLAGEAGMKWLSLGLTDRSTVSGRMWIPRWW